MSVWLKTQRCSEILNELYCSTEFGAWYIRDEIRDGRLKAGIYLPADGLTRHRARIKIHRDDFIAYVRVNHPRIADAIAARLIVAA